MALIDYTSQNDFSRRHIKAGRITRGGRWFHGRAWGYIWDGIVSGYHVNFETIGDGPLMRPGSFWVRCISAELKEGK